MAEERRRNNSSEEGRCWLCNGRKVVSRHSDLRRHYSDVHDENPRVYPCSYQCGYAAKQKSNLRTHENRHTGAKPHVCTQPNCFYATGDPAALCKHRKSRHPGIRGRLQCRVKPAMVDKIKKIEKTEMPRIRRDATTHSANIPKGKRTAYSPTQFTSSSTATLLTSRCPSQSFPPLNAPAVSHNRVVEPAGSSIQRSLGVFNMRPESCDWESALNGVPSPKLDVYAMNRRDGSWDIDHGLGCNQAVAGHSNTVPRRNAYGEPNDINASFLLQAAVLASDVGLDPTALHDSELPRYWTPSQKSHWDAYESNGINDYVPSSQSYDMETEHLLSLPCSQFSSPSQDISDLLSAISQCSSSPSESTCSLPITPRCMTPSREIFDDEFFKAIDLDFGRLPSSPQFA